MSILVGAFFIWLFFYLIGLFKQESAAGINQNTATNNAQGSTSQREHTDSFEAYFPFIDLYAYYALVDNRSWTPSKVRYIKNILEQHLVTEWNSTLLKERLKLKNNLSLNDLIHNLRVRLNGDHVEAKAVIDLICYMMFRGDVPEYSIKAKMRHLASNLGVTPHEVNQIFNETFNEQQEQQSSYSHNSQSKQQQNSPPPPADSSIEWACKVLGLSPDNITPESVQKAYRTKIKEYHPDKHQNLPESIQQLLHEKTLEVNEARDILSNA